ncbi:hypothetical protein NKH72_30160 [Mesorhizobium sp. M0955]|uniref:hypothetical protein n=1 Tax=Mesorhizobium sp. M0955 TaxID=2957033 RepID=UPI0033353027
MAQRKRWQRRAKPSAAAKESDLFEREGQNLARTSNDKARLKSGGRDRKIVFSH